MIVVRRLVFLLFTLLCFSSATAQDAYESDDQPSLNSPHLDYGAAAQSRNFHQVGDSDWAIYWLSANVRSYLQLQPVAGATSNQWHAELFYTEDGDTSLTRTLVAQGDFGVTGLTLTGDSRPTAGRLFWVHIQANDASFTGTASNYLLSLGGEVLPANTPDAYESDDLPSLNSPHLDYGAAAQSRNFHQAGDNDWAIYYLSANVRSLVKLQPVVGATSNNWHAELYSTEDGDTSLTRTLVGQGDFGLTGLTLTGDSRPTVGRLFWVRIQANDSAFIGTPSNYTLFLDGEVLPAIADAFEPDDQPSLNSPHLDYGAAAQAHNFHQIGDNDWAIYWLTANIRSYVQLQPVVGATTNKWHAELYYTEDGDATLTRTLVAQGDFGVSGLALTGDSRPEAGRLFWVRIRANDGSFIGTASNYSLSLGGEVLPAIADAFEPDDQPSINSPHLDYGAAPQAHNFHQIADNDWAIYWLTANIRSYVQLQPVVGATTNKWHAELYYTDDGDATLTRTLVAQGDFGVSGLTLTGDSRPAAGRLFWVRIRANDTSFIGTASNYSLSLGGEVLPLATLTLTATPNTNLVAPASTTLTSTLSSTAGVTSVSYFNGANQITCPSTPTPPSYSCFWQGITAGTYSVTAKAVIAGSSVPVTSAAVTLSVAPAPLGAPCVPNYVAPATFSTTTFAVSWTNANGCAAPSNYELRLAASQSGPWTTTIISAPALSANLTAPANGTYYSNIRACIAANCSAYSANVQTLVGTAPTASAETLYFHHTNAIGSVVATTDSAGNIVNRQHFRPFGSAQNRAGTATNDLGFTGKRFDGVLGLNYYGARYYDPQISRFISIDPADFSSDDLQSFGRYQYVNNNPLRFTDPDGRYKRGDGFNARQWRAFSVAQRSAAGHAERAVRQIDEQITRLRDPNQKLSGGFKSRWEKIFGNESATAVNLTAVKDRYARLATVLRDNGALDYIANSKSSTEWAGLKLGARALAAASTPGKVMNVNEAHTSAGNKSLLSDAIFHEAAHNIGEEHALVKGVIAYKAGTDQQVEAYKQLPTENPAGALRNPDSLVDFAQ